MGSLQTEGGVRGFSRARLQLARAACTAAAFASRLLGHAGGSAPGRVALAVMPRAIAAAGRDLGWKAMVTGTNGKTTTTALAAHLVRSCRGDVVTNGSGANMTAGIAAALLRPAHRPQASAVLECDELYTIAVAPDLRPDVLVLLNLSRDQLDRFAELEMTQRKIADAVLTSPDTSFAYCADDPVCQGVADLIEADAPGRHRMIPFGFSFDASDGLEGEAPAGGAHVTGDGALCPHCGRNLVYRSRTLGACGLWECPTGDFTRSDPAVAIQLDPDGCIRLRDEETGTVLDLSGFRLTGVSGACDACAAWIASGLLAGGDAVSAAEIARAFASFDPENGRGETLTWEGVDIRTQLAKNPVSMASALRDLDPGAGSALLLVINDLDADGHDVSWLWDVDDRDLLEVASKELLVCSGTRRDDVATRLLYAGADAGLIVKADDIASGLALARDRGIKQVDLVANYTVFMQAVQLLRDGFDASGAPMRPMGPAASRAVTTSAPYAKRTPRGSLSTSCASFPTPWTSTATPATRRFSKGGSPGAGSPPACPMSCSTAIWTPWMCRRPASC